jgi:hypothetical protein
MKSLSITLESSDPKILDSKAVEAYYGDYPDKFVFLGNGDATISFEDLDGLYDKFLLLKIFPNAGVYGSTNLKVTVSDDTLGNTYSTITNKEFTIPITIYPISVIHTGWANIKTVGQRNNIRDMYYTDQDTYINADELQTDEDKIKHNIGAKVELSWNEFLLRTRADEINVGIKGWYIFRRGQDEHYDFRTPLNEKIIPELTRTFVDSSSVLKPGKVYYYTVKAVDSKYGLLIGSREVFNEIRVLIPPDNTALIHRWIVNREVCSKLYPNNEENAIDPAKNFRCPYGGPGKTDVVVGGVIFSYYDLGKDLLVDINEAGCPYTSYEDNPNCTTQGCIGLELPSVAQFVDGQIFYHRIDGKCYVLEGGAWNEWDTANISQLLTVVGNVNRMDLPPITNISPTVATTTCTSRAIPAMDQFDVTGLTFNLPRRIEQVAYSAWDDSFSDVSILNREAGVALDNFPACNTSNASGLQHGFSETIIPSDGFFYAITGTGNSGIRLLSTGSLVTRQCVSKYGLQDVIGNAKEWAQGTIDCTTSNACFLDTSFDVNNSGVITPYAFDGLVGPCQDVDPIDGVCDSYGWSFDSASYNATRFAIPVGLPFVAEMENIRGVLQIGFISGINRGILHKDEFLVNHDDIIVNGNIGYIATGGDYKSEQKAGRYAIEFLTSYNNDVQKNRIGFRCVLELPNANYRRDPFHPYSSFY